MVFTALTTENNFKQYFVTCEKQVQSQLQDDEVYDAQSLARCLPAVQGLLHG